MNAPSLSPPSATVNSRAGHHRAVSAGPGWYRPALFVLLAATAVLYLLDLSSSGNANSFYAAAVEAGSKSWKAWFFGSLDSSNFITVDKPPGALWVMGLIARLFGYNSWSLLVPQALEGIAAVALLTATVRRVAGPAAGLIAGAVLALTPAAVLIFRFDNPDAFLVLLLVAAAYCVTRALEGGQDPVAGRGRRGRRVRVPHQERPGAAACPRVRSGLPGRGADHGPAPDRAPAGGRAVDGRRGRMVDRRRLALACGGPSLHRRQHG